LEKTRGEVGKVDGEMDAMGSGCTLARWAGGTGTGERWKMSWVGWRAAM
jgi:hypothetical protein